MSRNMKLLILDRTIGCDSYFLKSKFKQSDWKPYFCAIRSWLALKIIIIKLIVGKLFTFLNRLVDSPKWIQISELHVYLTMCCLLHCLVLLSWLFFCYLWTRPSTPRMREYILHGSITCYCLVDGCAKFLRMI